MTSSELFELNLCGGNYAFDYACSMSRGLPGLVDLPIGGRSFTWMNKAAHVKWDIEGDENSKFFHGLINQKRRNQMINGIMVEGNWITNPCLIKDAFLQIPIKGYFKLKIHRWISLSNNLGLPIGVQYEVYASWNKALSSKLIMVKKEVSIQMVVASRAFGLTLLEPPIFSTRKSMKILVLRSLDPQLLLPVRMLDIGLTKYLPTLDHATTWDKSIPRKVNVFMWRLSLDRLPHRLNLSLRGMDIPPSLVLLAMPMLNLLIIFSSSATLLPICGSSFLDGVVFLFFKLLLRILSMIGSSLGMLLKRKNTGFHNLLKEPPTGANMGVRHNAIYMDVMYGAGRLRLLKDKGIDFLQFIRKKIGNGVNTSFWADSWIGSIPFKRKFPRLYALEESKSISVADKLRLSSLYLSFRRPPRGGIEQESFNLLCQSVRGLVLSNIEDRWSWSLEGSGLFSVKSSRAYIDDLLLPKADAATRWIRILPIKINVFAWKVCLDALPTS
ncbi:hypothetical protein Tco_0323542 [Tanacetum coccineum]